MYHLYTIEKLYHFHCSLCLQWWTIGDWEEQATITCPMCKKTREVVDMQE